MPYSVTSAPWYQVKGIFNGVGSLHFPDEHHQHTDATETEELLVIMEGHGGRKSLVHHLFHIWVSVITTYPLPGCNQDRVQTRSVPKNQPSWIPQSFTTDMTDWIFYKSEMETFFFINANVQREHKSRFRWFLYLMQCFLTFFHLPKQYGFACGGSRIYFCKFKVRYLM